MASTDSVSHDDMVVCACGDREYKARDAIEAALFRGDLASKWNEFSRRVEAQKRAEDTDMELDEAALEAAAERFRYDHDLITAEETEQWLTARGLTLDDFGDYFARLVWANAQEDVKPQEVDYVSASPELRDLFTVDSILSGDLDYFTTQLTWRLAARTAEKDPDPEGKAAEERSFLRRNKMEPAQLPAWLERLGRSAEWLSEMAAMEAAYRERCKNLLVPQALQRELANQRLPLTRFEVEIIELESRDAAQESLFCVREDGMSMEEVASEGRYPYHRVNFVFEDVPADLQPKFLSVSAGDVLEPIPRGEGFELYRVVQKIEPKVDDPVLQQRIEQRMLERQFSDLAAKHVERRLGATSPGE